MCYKMQTAQYLKPKLQKPYVFSPDDKIKNWNQLQNWKNCKKKNNRSKCAPKRRISKSKMITAVKTNVTNDILHLIWKRVWIFENKIEGTN